MTEIEKYVRERLFALQDLGYRDFHAKLVPNLDKEKIIGVRAPALKKFAREFSKDKRAEEFIRKAASLGKPFAFLVKSQFWHAKRRLSLFDEFPPSYILPLTWRPDFFFKDDHGGSPLMDVMWCVWLMPHIKETQTVYRPLERPKGEIET